MLLRVLDASDDAISKFALVRNQKDMKNCDLFLSKYKLKPQKSGIGITIGVVALFVFSNYLNPPYNTFSSSMGGALFGVSIVSNLREIFF